MVEVYVKLLSLRFRCWKLRCQMWLNYPRKHFKSVMILMWLSCFLPVCVFPLVVIVRPDSIHLCLSACCPCVLPALSTCFSVISPVCIYACLPLCSLWVCRRCLPCCVLLSVVPGFLSLSESWFVLCGLLLLLLVFVKSFLVCSSFCFAVFLLFFRTSFILMKLACCYKYQPPSMVSVWVLPSLPTLWHSPVWTKQTPLQGPP